MFLYPAAFIPLKRNQLFISTRSTGSVNFLVELIVYITKIGFTTALNHSSHKLVKSISFIFLKTKINNHSIFVVTIFYLFDFKLVCPNSPVE